ncbi:putative F-box protein PP2-B12 isoform X2 [Capsicum annuum]|uniref:putative F-box protein PP2-B12 isoform X2 n=1 Tax=Capsicum annuum TaxID=4072 RepID=UPI001FB0DDCF|nr:putative F-box protein PP2-B12 isoform X2 [Capsicum annuum]
MENENPNILSLLPEDCTEKVLVFTSPVDVCRVSLVSKSLQSAADSDSVWEKFLPSDYQSIISASLTPIPDFGSKKDLYVYLCHNPILIDAGRKSFSLEKRTGKKCYFLGARDLNIAWADTPRHWRWTSLPESRFPEVVKLRRVWWLEIRGTIRVGVLSPRTSYVAYIVYKLKNDHGFHFRPSEVSVGVCGVELDTQFAFLVPKGRQYHPYKSIYRMSSATEDELEQLDDDNEEAVYIYFPCPYGRGPLLPVRASNLVQSNIRRRQLRDDGWFEIELGEFYTENEDDCIEMSLKEVNDCLSPKDGLIVEGIEIRPRMG